MTSIAILLATALSAAPAFGSAPRQLVAQGQPVADILRAMGEPPIGQLPPGNQVFRFLWMRSFHKPFLVQVDRQGDVTGLLVKALDSPWSAAPEGVHVGSLTLNQRTPLTTDAWDRLATMRRTAFWGKPSYDPAVETGHDGAMWILEARSWGDYHIVERWTPTEGAFRDMCIAMLELAGVTLLDERIY